jgi:hypothetical protein
MAGSRSRKPRGVFLTWKELSERRKDVRISREGHLVTLINTFETKPEQQQPLIGAWLRFVGLSSHVRETRARGSASGMDDRTSQPLLASLE